MNSAVAHPRETREPLIGSYPECPRCEYDLSGIVASWQDFCPLQGQCSECGSTLEWRRILDPSHAHVPGFYEHNRGLAFKSAWRTWLWCVLPWRFADRVRRAPFVRLRRAIAWIFIIWLTLSFTRSFISIIRIVFDSISTPRSIYSEPYWIWVVNAFLYPFVALYHEWSSGAPGKLICDADVPIAHILIAFAITLTPPLVFFTLGRRADGQRPHWRSVARLVPYGFAWIAVPYFALIALTGHWSVMSVLAHLFGGDFNWFGSPLQVLTSPAVLAGVILPWLVLWWWFMGRRVLELRQMGLLLPIALVISWLLAAVLFVALDRSYAFLDWLGS